MTFFLKKNDKVRKGTIYLYYNKMISVFRFSGHTFNKANLPFFITASTVVFPGACNLK